MDIDRASKRTNKNRSAGLVHLLSEVAPELSLRGIFADDSPAPELYRGLISVLLRASTPSVALGAYEALRASSGAHVSAPTLSKLGCVSTNSENALRSAIQDVISSIARSEPLRATNAALQFYGTAGVGAADTDEYENPAREGLAESTAFGTAQPPLAETRLNSCALLLRYLALVVMDARAPVPAVASERVRARLVDDIVPRAHTLPPRTLAALQELLAATLAYASPAARDDTADRIVHALAALPVSSPNALCVYACSLSDASVKFRACVLFLAQFCGAGRHTRDTEPQSLTIANFVKRFVVIRVSRRPRKVSAPAVLTALAEAWLELADPSCFALEGPDEKRAVALNTLNEQLLQLTEKCDAPAEHTKALMRIAMAIQARALCIATQ